MADVRPCSSGQNMGSVSAQLCKAAEQQLLTSREDSSASKG